MVYLLVLAAPAALVWAVDPLQLYRRAWYPPDFSSERYQNPGLARNYDYSAIIVGTSYVQNFSPAGFERETGRKTLKLSVAGGTAREEHLTAKVALRTGRVKVVYWGVDPVSFTGDPYRVRSDRHDFPAAFYDDWLLTDIPGYLLNGDEIGHALRLLARHCCRRTPFDDGVLEHLNVWPPGQYRFGRAEVVAQWNRTYCHARRTAAATGARTMVDSVRINIEALVRQYRDTRFVLFFPPYTTLYQKMLEGFMSATYDEILELRAHVYGLGREPNVEVFDFQNDHEITHDLDRYKDLQHYDPAVNARMLTAFREGRFRVRPEEARSRLDELASTVRAYPQHGEPPPDCQTLEPAAATAR